MESREKQITKLLAKVVNMRGSFTETILPSYKIKYASAVRGVYMITWESFTRGRETHYDQAPLLSYTLKSRPIF